MKKNHWFNGIIVAVLIAMAAITAHQIVATAQTVAPNTSQAAASGGADVARAASFDCPFTPAELQSLHSVYIQQIGRSVPFTVDGPAGVEGGLYMLRYCKVPSK